MSKFLYHMARPYTWNPIVHHIPLYFYFLWLIVRYRGWMFLYCNPSIEYSGILNDSKSTLHNRLVESDADLKKKVISRHLNIEEKMQQLADFLTTANLSYPIVLKPDRGLRSYGVRVILNERAAKAYFKKAKFDVMAQEYCDYNFELLVYFCINPISRKCQVLSTGVKTPPFVYGDGRSSVKQLVLSHSHYSLFKENILGNGNINWNKIPRPGEAVRISDIFKQSLGCIHESRNDIMTAELQKWIDKTTSSLEDFSIGRFDIKFRDEVSLKQGKNFKVLELNGGSSVPSLFRKSNLIFLNEYYTMFFSWDLAFKMGSIYYAKNPKLKVSNLRFLADTFKMRRFITKLKLVR